MFLEKKSNYTYFFKVQNDKQRVLVNYQRGEITKDRTLRNPEHTEYNGVHYVECYGVNKIGECVQRDRCYVEVEDGIVYDLAN